MAGNIVRKYASTDTPYHIPKVNIPKYWIRPQQILSSKPGMHRFLWDVHYTPLPLPPVYPIAAIYGNTAPLPTSPWVLPGKYIVELEANGKKLQQNMEVIMDPRVTTSKAQLQQQFTLAKQCYEIGKTCLNRLNAIQEKLMQSNNNDNVALKALQGNNVGRRGMGSETSYNALLQQSQNVLSMLEDADMPPTVAMQNAVQQLTRQLQQLEQKWQSLANL
jgi:hypothetical protein